MKEEKYLGYCFFTDGTHTPAVTLRGIEAALRYVNLQMKIQYRVIITDVDDCIVIEAIRGEITFPRPAA